MSKANRIRYIVGLLSMALMASAHAEFNIQWYTLIGGYQLSAGGNYSVTSSAVESTGGAVTGGNYVVQGGYALQGVLVTTGDPILTVYSQGEACVVSWPVAATGFSLQRATDLAHPNWQAVPQAPTQIGDNYLVTIPVATGSAFFRLAAPRN